MMIMMIMMMMMMVTMSKVFLSGTFILKMHGNVQIFLPPVSKSCIKNSMFSNLQGNVGSSPISISVTCEGKRSVLDKD